MLFAGHRDGADSPADNAVAETRALARFHHASGAPCGALDEDRVCLDGRALIQPSGHAWDPVSEPAAIQQPRELF